MTYEKKDELVNTVTHGIGIIGSFVAAYFLLSKATSVNNDWKTISYTVFCLGMLFTYSMSTVYHALDKGKWKDRFQVLDHISIFWLIAGSYTPFLLVPLREYNGWMFLWIVWGITAGGTLFKIFFTGRFKLFSSLLYLGMGWIIVFAGQSMIEQLNATSLYWLFAGGLFYSVGVIFYLAKKLAYSHGIFHMFVLGGTVCHVISVHGL